MPIIFYDEIKKADARDAALRKLRSFLDESEPELVYWLQHIWNNQQRAITYKELREAIMNGTLDEQLIYDWQQDYSRFVITHLRPSWKIAMEAAVTQLTEKYPLFAFDPATEGIKEWLDTKAASFVTNSTTTQIEAINAVVSRSALIQDMTVDGLARAIRPMVGLTKPQAVANLNYYTAMVESGLSEKVALERSIKYSARQNRYRGYNIARTELAFAYNKGEHSGIEQAIDKGYMGRTRKRWCTADDGERVCKICRQLEKVSLEMDEEFYYTVKDRNGNERQIRINPKLTAPGIGRTPPAHPSCRFTLLYEEVEPPNYADWIA